MKENNKLKTLQFIAPYLITAGLVAGATKMMGSWPFVREREKMSLSNIGKFHTTYVTKSASTTDVLYAYSKWYQEEDHYAKDIKVYPLSAVKEEDVKAFLNNENVTLEDLFGEPLSWAKETKDKLTKDDLEENEHYKAVVYNATTDEYLLVKEDSFYNIGLTILYVLLTGFGFGVVNDVKEDIEVYKMQKEVREASRKRAKNN